MINKLNQHMLHYKKDLMGIVDDIHDHILLIYDSMT